MQTSAEHCQLLLRLWDYFIIVSIVFYSFLERMEIDIQGFNSTS